MANIQELAKKFESVEDVKTELKRIQSVKCRLKKQKALPDYDVKMAEVLKDEQNLKEVRQLFEPKKVTYTTMTAEQIAELDYEETIRAIKSIQSKKCLVQHNTDDLSKNVDYQEAVKQEELLLAHKATVKPVDDFSIRKSAVVDMIDHIENLDEKLDKEYVLELLKGLLA